MDAQKTQPKLLSVKDLIEALLVSMVSTKLTPNFLYCSLLQGTAYGIGVYFAAGAHYSHSYTRVNSAGERCMFVAKVLIGNSTPGNSLMKVCPVGYDSTTGGSNIFVAYHDAQSYAEYFITYK
jgi:Poly(ADP-ribose) polymerase catalytic domain